jgi:hypothetical protein
MPSAISPFRVVRTVRTEGEDATQPATSMMGIPMSSAIRGADTRNNPRSAYGPKNKASAEHECEIEYARLENLHDRFLHSNQGVGELSPTKIALTSAGTTARTAR